MLTARGIATGNPDEAETLELYKQSCEAGYGPGCAAAATMLASGRGADKDENAARDLQAKGCELGFKRACGE